MEDALAQRPASSFEKGKEWRMGQVWQSLRTTRPAVRAYDERSHTATSHDAVAERDHVAEKDSWLTSMSRTFKLGVGEEIRMLVEAFDKPEGPGMHTRHKRNSLRSASWRG